MIRTFITPADKLRRQQVRSKNAAYYAANRDSILERKRAIYQQRRREAK